MHRLFIAFFVLLFLFSCNRHLVVHEINTRNITVSPNVASVDSVMESIVKPYRDSIENDMNTLVALSAAPLVKGKPESKLTNQVADILLDFGIAYAKKHQLNILPDVSYVNYGGLRASLPQGEITVQRIFELMPFENELVMVELSGDGFMQMANKIAARGGEGVAGLKLGIRNGKAGSLTVRGQAVDPTASYWVVTSDYIANGGDQMSMFIDARQRINTGIRLRDELIRALTVRYKESGIIDINEDGRIYHER